MLIWVVVVVVLVEVDVEIGAAAEEVVEGGGGNLAAVDVEGFELLDSGQYFEARSGDGDVDQMEALEGGKRCNCLHAGVGDMRCAKAELFELRELVETDQTGVGEVGVGEIKDAERLEAGNLSEGGVIDAAAAVADMLEGFAVGQAAKAEGGHAASFVVQEENAEGLEVLR
jgi:hypothetical protein